MRGFNTAYNLIMAIVILKNENPIKYLNWNFFRSLHDHTEDENKLNRVALTDNKPPVVSVRASNYPQTPQHRTNCK